MNLSWRRLFPFAPSVNESSSLPPAVGAESVELSLFSPIKTRLVGASVGFSRLPKTPTKIRLVGTCVGISRLPKIRRKTPPRLVLALAFLAYPQRRGKRAPSRWLFPGAIIFVPSSSSPPSAPNPTAPICVGRSAQAPGPQRPLGINCKALPIFQLIPTRC